MKNFDAKVQTYERVLTNYRARAERIITLDARHLVRHLQLVQ